MVDYDSPCGEVDCNDDCDSKLHHQNVILSCGSGAGLILPIGGSCGCDCGSKSGWQAPTLVVATVNIDTLRLHKPTVKIDFSSLINFKATSGGGEYFLGIIFQLSKFCNNGCKIPLTTWNFEKKVDIISCCCDPNGAAPNLEPVRVNDPSAFSFTWCECHDCPGCCTYILEVIDFASACIDFASITNISITAMAV